MKLVIKSTNILLALLMALFAAVQYNDPDAIFWIFVYLISAIGAGMAAFRLDALKSNLPLTILAACLVLEFVGSVYYWPSTPGFWRMDVWWETETAREGMGIAFSTLVLAFAFLTAYLARIKSASSID